MLKSTKNICLMALGIALYVVLSMTVKIPLISHIQTDLGYVAFGIWCSIFGWYGFIVGTIGCMLESLIISGWIPIGWMLGQVVIGLICGSAYKHCNSAVVKVLLTIIAIFIGIAGIKTIVECYLYSIPFEIKVIKNIIASVADIVPMIIGMYVGCKFKSKTDKFMNSI